MTIERIKHSGAWCISAVVDGHLETRVYYFYSRSEAAERFKAEFPNA